jgi:hypothetical protein
MATLGIDSVGITQTNDDHTYGAGANGGNKWATYFGPSNAEIKTNPYDKFGYTNFDLPDAYKGRNMFLRDTIDGFIMEDFSWYTTVCLPYVRTDEHHFVWNEWHFDTHLVGRVPEEGISRLIRSSKRSFKESTVRRGIAFQLEHGFMNTPDGRQQYVMNLKQIKQSVQETANHDVIAAILSSRRYDKEWERKHGYNQKAFPVAHRREVTQWAIAQKHPNGLDIMHEEFKQRLGRWNVTPNMWIFPPKLCLYLTMVPPEKTEWKQTGPEGPSKFNAGPKALTTFRGVSVYETRMFDVYEGDLPIDLLRRHTTIGEYNVMDDPLHHAGLSKYDNYDTNIRDVVIFNEDDDQWARISFREALKHVDRDITHDDTTFNSKINNDCLYFKNAVGAMTRCVLFGHMEEKHLSNATIRKVVKTMVKNGFANIHSNIKSMVGKYNYEGPSGVPMFRKATGGVKGLPVSYIEEKVSKIGQDSAFVNDTAKRLSDPHDVQRFLSGVSSYLDSTDSKTAKNLYKAMAKKAPKEVTQLKTWLAQSPFWDADLDVTSLSVEDVWEKTSETWKPEYANDPSWMPGDPSTHYTTPTKKHYIPSDRWEDTPWMVASRQGDVQTERTRRAMTSGNMFANSFDDDDLTDILGADAGAKMARIGAPLRHRYGQAEDLLTIPVENVSRRWEWANSTFKDDPDALRAATIFLTAEATVENLVAMANENYLVPFNLLLMRPGMEYEMCSAVLMKGGVETGMTAVGHNDFQLGDDVASKMHYGHYTFKSKAFVQQPRNIIIAENIFAQGYSGGNGVGFHYPKDENSLHPASIHVWLASYEQTHFPSPIDLSGKHRGETGNGTHIAGCDYHIASGRWKAHQRENENAVDDDFLEQHDRTNTVCYQGHQFNYDLDTSKHTVVTRNTGHWGPNVYPGCGAVRAGEAHCLREMNYQTTAR